MAEMTPEMTAFVEGLYRMVKGADAAGSGLRVLSGEYANLEQEILNNINSLKKNTVEWNKGLKGVQAYKKQQQDLRDNITKARQELILQTSDNIKNQNALNKLRKEVEITSDKYAAFTKGINNVNKSFHSVISSSLKLAGSTTAIGFSLGELSKVNMDYAKNVLQVSRVQTIAGRTSGDMANALDKVKNNTVMARTQFLQLSAEIQNSFIGLAPSLSEQADLMKTVGEQFGFNYAKAKELYAFQSKFPQLYSQIEGGLKLMEKINTGKATQAEREKLELIKNQALSYSMIANLGPEANNLIIQSLTELTSKEKENNAVIKEREKLQKEVAELQLEMAKALLPYQKKALELISAIAKASQSLAPILLKVGAAIGAINLLPVISGTSTWIKGMLGAKQATAAVVGTSKAVAGATKASLSFGKIAKLAFLGPKGKAAALAIGVGLLIHRFIKAKNAAEDMQKQMMKQGEIDSEIASMTSEQKQKYEEIKRTRIEAGNVEKDILKEHEAITSELKEEAKGADTLFKEYEKTNVVVQKQLEMIEHISKALGTAASVAEQFGMRNRDALSGLADVAGMQVEERAKDVASAFQAQLKNLEDSDIDIGIDSSASIEEQVQQLTKASLLVKNMNLDENQRLTVNTAIMAMMKSAEPYLQASANAVQKRIDLQFIDIKQQEQFTSKYEARLDAERRLMESAQFGMGASVDMMQKQVDLAYELMQTYADMDKNWATRLRNEKGVAAHHIKAIQSARTQAEAENYISDVVGARGDLQKELNSYAHNHQEITKKTMDQQQKIYDLTKDIREGYLDAIREMSFGAGEFEKIIGTQDMGVTQLMGTVKDVTGEAKLNTMKLGGMQSAAMTAGGVGTDYAGQYTAGGARFLGAGKQEARNERIYKYGQYKSEAEAVMKGEVPGRRSEMGGGAVPGAQDGYIDPHRMEKANEDGSYKGVRDGVKDAFGSKGFGSRSFTQSMGVNAGVARGNAPGREDSSLMQGGAQAGAMGANILRKSPHHGRASGGYVPGLPKDWAAEWATVKGLSDEELKKKAKKVNDAEFKPGEIASMTLTDGSMVIPSKDDFITATKKGYEELESKKQRLESLQLSASRSSRDPNLPQNHFDKWKAGTSDKGFFTGGPKHAKGDIVAGNIGIDITALDIEMSDFFKKRLDEYSEMLKKPIQSKETKYFDKLFGEGGALDERVKQIDRKIRDKKAQEGSALDESAKMKAMTERLKLQAEKRELEFRQEVRGKRVKEKHSGAMGGVNEEFAQAEKELNEQIRTRREHIEELKPETRDYGPGMSIETEKEAAVRREKAEKAYATNHLGGGKSGEYLGEQLKNIDEKYKKLTGGKEVHNYVLGLQEMVEKTKQVREELEKNKVDEWHSHLGGHLKIYNKSYQTYLDNVKQARYEEQRANEQLQKGIELQQERDSEISGISVGYQGRKREDEREERETQEHSAQEEQKNEHKDARKKIQEQMDAIRKKKMAEIHGVDESDIEKFHSMGAINPYDLKDNQEYQDLKEKFTSLGGDYGVTFDGANRTNPKDSYFYGSSKKKRRERERMDRDPEYERKVRTEAMDRVKEEGMAAAEKAISLGGGADGEQSEAYKIARKEAEEKFKKYRSHKHYLEKFEARQRGDIPEERTSQELSALGGQYVQSMGTLKGTPRERAMQARSRATRAGLGSGVHHEDAEQYNKNIKARKEAYQHVSNAQAKDVALSGVSTIHTKRQGHTSAAAARGEEASAAAQAEWQERRHEAEVGGIGMDEGGAGGGQALITIRLEEGLKGQVEKAAGIAVQFESA